MKKIPKKPGWVDEGESIRNRLRKPLARAEVTERVDRMTERVGLLPQKLASWFVLFASAPASKLQRFKDEAEFVASTKGASPLKENRTIQDLERVRSDAQNAILWALDQKSKVKGISTAPLEPIPVDMLLQRVSDGIEKTLLPLDFRGRLLLRLFDLLSAKLPFALCKTCQKIFARRGRQLYCGPRCAEKARPKKVRRRYFRKYMENRRAFLRRLKSKAPELAERVTEGELSLTQARTEIRKRETRAI